MKKIMFAFVIQLLCFSSVYSQTRIAVLPFTNMDGHAKYNIWCYNLQDSLAVSMAAEDPTESMFRIVPRDSVENILSEMNLDPSNPQYLSDMWLAVERLNVDQVISGNFKIQAKRFLINAYIYNVATKLPNHEHQSRDNFKKEDKVYDAIPVIVKDLMKAYK